MKVEKKSLGKCQVQLDVKLDAAEMSGIVKKVERAFMREAKLPGFRPGKCPIEIIRREFAGSLKQEINRTMFSENIDAVAKEADLKVVGVTGLKDEKYSEEGGSFTAIVDVEPEFKLPAYKGLKIELKDATVPDDAVAAQIERLREAYARFEDSKEGDKAAKGDFVQIDYSGTIDSKPISEVAPADEAKVLASGNGFWTQIEDGRFIPEILDAIVGMQAGETKEVKVKFAKEGVPEGVAGKKAVYSLTLKSFRRRILPTDAEFVEKAKAESIEKMTADMREAMQKRADEDEKIRRENEVVDALLKRSDFDIPASVVARARDSYLEQYAKRAKSVGLGDEFFKENGEKIMKEATEYAERQVRLFYILDAIAKAENIEGEEDEVNRKVIEFVLANVKR